MGQGHRISGEGREAVPGDGPPMGPGATGTGAGGAIVIFCATGGIDDIHTRSYRIKEVF